MKYAITSQNWTPHALQVCLRSVWAIDTFIAIIKPYFTVKYLKAVTLIHLSMWRRPYHVFDMHAKKVSNIFSGCSLIACSKWSLIHFEIVSMVALKIKSGSKFISHADRASEKVSFTYFTGSKFILPAWESRVLSFATDLMVQIWHTVPECWIFSLLMIPSWFETNSTSLTTVILHLNSNGRADFSILNV